MSKSLTLLESGLVDKLRVRMAELGYPLDNVSDEAVVLAAWNFKKCRVYLKKLYKQMKRKGV
ncbi:unnamed protein product [marine sediment metagenome]|uniref:Uncharacterized protein n=1 Tax=marine sediment metagenome TaxID=412755 RepID=X1CB51_9ZZZZ